jgi:hypothetical protein
LIGTNHLSIVFRVELAREFGRVSQVTEHYRKLASFSLRCAMFGGWFGLGRLVLLGCRLLC